MADVPPLESADEYITEIPDGLAIGVEEQVAVLHALRRVQGAQLDPDRCQRLLIECAVTALRADLGWLSLATGTGQDFSIVASVGMPEGHVTQQSLSGIGAQAARRHATLVVNDFERSTRTPEVARKQLLEGGVRSLICTPLVAGELIGLLCVARRSGNGFARRDGVLLGSLAAQGAMTINNGRIVAEIERRATSLQAALSVGARAHDSVLADEGLSGAARVLAGALGRSVSIHQDIVVEEPRWFGPDGRILTRPADHPAVHIDLLAAGETLGSIRVEGPGELDDLQRQAVDVASTAIVS